jgi:glutamyl-Q tRNA(Asp) synthetase
LAARKAGGQWLLRIEDLDPPRVVPGSIDAILAALESFGFEWAESIMYQSERRDAYEAALNRLRAQGLAYPCSCSRSEVQAQRLERASHPPGRSEPDEPYYPGWCRNGVRAPDRPTAIRLLAPAGALVFHDELQGAQEYDFSETIGDFVIRRRDGLHAYQLAVVVDDAAQRITHVVRGADLLSSTPRQLCLQRALGLPAPMYAHLPLVTDANGIKLSKSTGAAAVNVHQPSGELWRALRFLRQAPPVELRSATVAELWEWALEHWCVQPLRGLRYAAIDDSA